MTKGLYITGSILGGIFDAYLLIMISMILSKNENITAFAVVGAIVPLIAGLGCLVWFIIFILKIASNKILLKNYKFPLVLTSIPIATMFFFFFISKIFI